MVETAFLCVHEHYVGQLPGKQWAGLRGIQDGGYLKELCVPEVWDDMSRSHHPQPSQLLHCIKCNCLPLDSLHSAIFDTVTSHFHSGINTITKSPAWSPASGLALRQLGQFTQLGPILLFYSPQLPVGPKLVHPGGSMCALLFLCPHTLYLSCSGAGFYEQGGNGWGLRL